MSHELISRSPDLKRLRDEGFDIAIHGGHLLVRQVPYVDKEKNVRRGTLMSTLQLAGDRTGPPDTHVAMLIGVYPCDEHGCEIDQIRHAGRQQLLPDLVADFSFSSKPVPAGRYVDYYEKMTTYAAILTSPAQAIEPGVTARTFSVVQSEDDQSVFNYLDTATSRAGIGMAVGKLRTNAVGIVGVGGTGSYVLDLVAKTPVTEIHIFDDDLLYSHNAFRSPGAASIEELRASPKKGEYYRAIYSRLRRGIVFHDVALDRTNVQDLSHMDFVFVCVDAGDGKKVIIDYLLAAGKPFIDVGMGVENVNGTLRGILRITASTPTRCDHVRERVSMSDGGDNDEYDVNIQLADLNALNASLAVIRWKKMLGFYVDLEHELNSTYTIDGNQLLNSELP